MTSREKDPGLFWGVIGGLGALLVISLLASIIVFSHNAGAEERKECLQSGQTWDDRDSFCYTPGGTDDEPVFK